MSPANHRAQTPPPLRDNETRESPVKSAGPGNPPINSNAVANEKATPPNDSTSRSADTDAGNSNEAQTLQTTELNPQPLRDQLDESVGLTLDNNELQSYVATLQAIFPGKFLGIKQISQTPSHKSTPHAPSQGNLNHD